MAMAWIWTGMVVLSLVFGVLTGLLTGLVLKLTLPPLAALGRRLGLDRRDL